MSSVLRFPAALLAALLLSPAPVPAADTYRELSAKLAAEVAELAKDADYTAFDRSFVAPGERPKVNESPEQLRWDFAALDNLLRAGEAYLARHPDSPHRWRVALRTSGVFALQTGRLVAPEARAALAGVLDEAALADWARKLAGWRAAVVAAPEFSAAQKLQVELAPLRGYSTEAGLLKSRFTGWSAWRAELDRLAGAYPDETLLLSQYDLHLRARRAVDPAGTLAAIRAEWARLASSPNHAIAAESAAKVCALDLEITKETGLQAAPPFELAFTAADGRAVDLARLRGKVVLIDFWATWCGPCLAELPNVKRVYAAYHTQGFEVVGIALENARLADTDTEAQRTAKLAKARETLLAFTAQNEMPWPQYFDGKHWKNDVSTRYAIGSIPAMFLLDRAGRVVSTVARGPKLETEVRRLLGLETAAPAPSAPPAPPAASPLVAPPRGS